MDYQSNEILNISKIQNKKIHIIGCGATGSHLAVELVKLGANNLVLWDFDIVNPHNITNQIWTTEDIGKKKNEALCEHLLLINPELENRIKIKEKWTDELLDGIIFNCVDSVELRKAIYEANQYNPNIKVMFDPRLGSTTGSVFTYEWNTENAGLLIKLSDFKDEEIVIQRSMCGTKVNISTTLFTLINYLLINFVNYLNGNKYYQQIYFEPLNYKITYLKEVQNASII